MAAVTPSPWKTAATEHSPEVSLLRTTKMSANVVFINMDWKKSKHFSTQSLQDNMETLGKTITNVVRNMDPTMICMCEVGQVMTPLTEEQMQEVEHQITCAWKGAATEHFDLRSMSKWESPT